VETNKEVLAAFDKSLRAFIGVRDLIPCRRDAIGVTGFHYSPILFLRTVEREAEDSVVFVLFEYIGDIRRFAIVEPKDTLGFGVYRHGAIIPFIILN
jgi:hypothetical protein